MVIIVKVAVVILTAVVVIIKNMACHGISGWRIFINVKVVIINVAVIIVKEAVIIVMEAVIIVREAVIIVKDLVIILIEMAHQCASVVRRFGWGAVSGLCSGHVYFALLGVQGSEVNMFWAGSRCGFLAELLALG